MALPPEKRRLATNRPPLWLMFATIRTDLNINSMASKLLELLQTKAAKRVIAKSG